MTTDGQNGGAETSPRQGSFNVLYLAGMGALALLGAVVGLTLAGERHSGFVGDIEIIVLGGGALLLIAAGLGARSVPGASWPLLAALAAVILVTVLVFLTLTEPDASSAVLLELGGLAIGVVLVVMLRQS